MEATAADLQLVPRATKEVAAPDSGCCRVAVIAVVVTSVVILSLGVLLGRRLWDWQDSQNQATHTKDPEVAQWCLYNHSR
jgi:hypothetical protein